MGTFFLLALCVSLYLCLGTAFFWRILGIMADRQLQYAAIYTLVFLFATYRAVVTESTAAFWLYVSNAMCALLALLLNLTFPKDEAKTPPKTKAP